MQILYRDTADTLVKQFRDAAGDVVIPEGTITVTIQHQDSSVPLITAAATTDLGSGQYSYDISPTSMTLGYYGVWWNTTDADLLWTLDLPEVFKIEARKESIVKGIMAERVRSMLNMHTDSSGFQNKFKRSRELLDYLQESLNWWNAYPPAVTFHSFTDLSTAYYGIIEEGAVIKALQALGIYEAGKHFQYNDNGISLMRDRSAKYQAIWGPLLQHYVATLKQARTKYAFDALNARGMFSSTTGFPRSLSRALRGVSKFA